MDFSNDLFAELVCFEYVKELPNDDVTEIEYTEPCQLSMFGPGDLICSLSEYRKYIWKKYTGLLDELDDIYWKEFYRTFEARYSDDYVESDCEISDDVESSDDYVKSEDEKEDKDLENKEKYKEYVYYEYESIFNCFDDKINTIYFKYTYPFDFEIIFKHTTNLPVNLMLLLFLGTVGYQKVCRIEDYYNKDINRDNRDNRDLGALVYSGFNLSKHDNYIICKIECDS